MKGVACGCCGSENTVLDGGGELDTNCLDCGYRTFMVDTYMSLDEVNEYRKEAGQEPLTELRQV